MHRLKHLSGRAHCLDTTGGDLQMQYLISVLYDQAGLTTPDEHGAIDVFNDLLQAEGHWVVVAGLASPNAGHRHRQPGRGGAGHRRALHRVEGVPRRLLDNRGARPRRGARARHRGVEVPGASRAAAASAGARKPYGSVNSARRKTAPVSRTLRSTSDRASVSIAAKISGF